jgi:hypothetical protein
MQRELSEAPAADGAPGPRVLPWGETAAAEGDFVWYSAYQLHTEDTVAITGLGRGDADSHWRRRGVWPRCAFPDGTGGYGPAARAGLVSDTESRVLNPEIAEYKLLVLYCTRPAAAPRRSADDHLRLTLGRPGEAVAVVVRFATPPAAPQLALCVCSRVFGESVHARFVGEWFAHYRALGAAHFVLHDSADAAGRVGGARADLARALETQRPRASVDIVALVGAYRTWAYHQKLGYYDCLFRQHARAAWLLFADLDEVVWLRAPTRAPPDALASLLARLPAATSALVLQFAEVLTFVCRGDERLPLLDRLVFAQTPAAKATLRYCVGGKYLVRPAAHVREQLNTHAPRNRTRPACVMAAHATARMLHFHQIEHSGVLSEKGRAWRPAAFCEEAGDRYRPSDAPRYGGRYVNLLRPAKAEGARAALGAMHTWNPAAARTARQAGGVADPWAGPP